MKGELWVNIKSHMFSNDCLNVKVNRRFHASQSSKNSIPSRLTGTAECLTHQSDQYKSWKEESLTMSNNPLVKEKGKEPLQRNNGRALSDPTVLLIKTDCGSYGSGFFVRENLIVTNIHVVAGAASVSARLAGTKAEFVIEGVTAYDGKNDLILLKTSAKGTPLCLGDSDAVQDDEAIFAIGHPTRKYKITEGGFHSYLNGNKWLRMKVDTNRGNSGGPVVNNKGEVIGVIFAKYYSYSYATSSNTLKELITRLEPLEPLVKWIKREVSCAYAYYREADKKSELNICDKAITKLLDEAILSYPDFPLFYYKRGEARSALGQSKAEEDNVSEAWEYCQNAIDDYTQAIRLCPDHYVFYDQRGRVKSILGRLKKKIEDVVEAQHHYQDAIDDCTESIKLCPEFAVAYNNRGYMKYLLGKLKAEAGNMEDSQKLYEEAKIDSDIAIKLDPYFNGVYEFYHTRGVVKSALRDFRGAIDDLDRTIKLKSDYVKAYCDRESAKRALEQQKNANLP